MKKRHVKTQLCYYGILEMSRMGFNVKYSKIVGQCAYNGYIIILWAVTVLAVSTLYL